MENNDRDNEPCISVETLGLSLYKYHDHTCLSLGGSTVSNSCCWGGPESSDGQVVLWDMTIDEFLKTVYFIESVLSGKGSPYLCRAYFEVELDFAKVLVKAFYGQHVLMPSNSTRGDEVQWKLRKYYVPKFEICFL
ncbi:hypothetical protein IT399_03460 [Candidatus Nomurabacteria bacterium]|nr:hypothetical protein [Candidatus Nomurabacteria bacterium]